MKYLMFFFVLLSGCMSSTVDDKHKHDGVILFTAYSFEIFRVRIDGVSYLVNSKGGIVKEETK